MDWRILLERHILFGMMIPAILVFLTGFVQSIVKNKLLPSNFYLGFELSIAAIAHGFLNLAEEAHAAHKVAGQAITSVQIDQMFYTGECVAAAIGALLMTILLKQQTKESYERITSGISLGILGNLLGGTVLSVIVFLKLMGTI
jgi:hypothetical protein